MKKIIVTLIGLLTFMVAVALVRTARFTSRQIQVPAVERIALDRDRMAERLSRAIQHKTISDRVLNPSVAAVFKRFHTFLANSFPLVHAHLAKEIVGENSLLFTWEGRDNTLKPILLMGHMDVVPVDPETENEWTYPPFSGRMADGYLLFLIPLPFNDNFLYITFSPTALPPSPLSRIALPCNRHSNLQIGSDLAIKKPAKKLFRVLAGIRFKPKRLLAT